MNKSTNSVAKIFNVEYDIPTVFAAAMPTITGSFNSNPQYLIDNEDLSESPEDGYFLFELGRLTSTINNYVANAGGTNIDIIPGVTIGQHEHTFSSSPPSVSETATEKVTDFTPPKIMIGSYTVPIRAHLSDYGIDNKPGNNFIYRTYYIFRNNDKYIGYNLNRRGSSGNPTFSIDPRVSLPWEAIPLFRSIFKETELFTYTAGDNYFNFVTSKRDRTKNPHEVTLISTIEPFSKKYPFPQMGIKKDYAEFSGKIEFSDFKNPRLTIDGASTSTNSGTVSNFVSNKETNLSSKSQNRLLRGLLFESTVSASGTNGNTVNELTAGKINGDRINNGGDSTTPLSFKVNNGSNWAKVQISYSTGVPTFTLVDYYPKSSETKNSFTFSVEHKEVSGLVRRKYNITLLTPDTNKLTVDTNTIPSSSTYTDIDRSSLNNGYAVFDGGNLKVTLSNFIFGYFPALTLGSAKIKDTPSAQIVTDFKKLKLIYDNTYSFDTRIHFYTASNPFDDKDGFYGVDTHAQGMSKEIISGKHVSSDNKNLNISSLLRLNIPKQNIVEMRKNINKKSITLTPEDSTENVVTATIGTHNEGKTLFTVDSSTTPNFKYKYPTIIFEKDQPTKSAHITLDTNYKKESLVKFDVNGNVTNSATGVTSANFYPGLSFGGSYQIYQGETKIGDPIPTNGVDKYTSAGDTTETHKFTLKDTLENNVKISLKHNVNGLIDFSLDEWSTDAEVDFRIVYYEGSGLMRQTTIVKLITPRI
ncbi:MAG: hypothetical protein ACRC92_01960, partial [Peptostreptococcaceae bacterium]